MTGFSNFEPAMSGKWLELLKEIAPSVMALESMGMTSVRPPNPAAARRDAMQALWKDAGLEMVETRVIRIQTAMPTSMTFGTQTLCRSGRRAKLSPACRRVPKQNSALACAIICPSPRTVLSRTNHSQTP
jgi:hypothetical protein